MDMTLFGTDGIRGTAGEYPMTPEFTCSLGRVLAQNLLKQSPNPLVLTAKDTRSSGHSLEMALITGLSSQGVLVESLGVMPTPGLAYTVSQTPAQAGIILTASHNPACDNGIKLFDKNGYKLNQAQEQALEKKLLTHSLSPLPAIITPPLAPQSRFLSHYLNYLKEQAGNLDLSSVTLILDTAHGAASQMGEKLLTSLGAKVICIGNQPNGQNINLNCGAMHPQQTADLVKKHQANLGVCLDGDGDRCIFVDEKGHIISGDNLLGLFAIALNDRNKLNQNTLVATVMSNWGLRQSLQSHHIQVITTPVGDRWVSETMRQQQYNFGGENSGHIIFGDQATSGDGLLTTLKLLQLMQFSQSPLSQLSQSITLFPQKLTHLDVKQKTPISQLPDLQKSLDKLSKTLALQGRLLVRYSGTENKIRILVEHKLKETTEKISQEICDLIKFYLN